MTGDRTVRADARANRERIVEAARALYAEEGPEVSFNAVAHRAGIGNATLYRHFGSHEELREAVYLARLREACDLVVELAALDDPAVELRRYLTWLFETADLSLLGLGLVRGSVSARVRSEAARLRDLIDDLVLRAHREAVLRPEVGRDDLLVAATALVHIARHSEIPEARGTAFLEVVLRGLDLAT